PGVLVGALVPGDAVLVRVERTGRAPRELVRRVVRRAQVVVVPGVRVRALVDLGAGHPVDGSPVGPAEAELGVGAAVVGGPGVRIGSLRDLRAGHVVDRTARAPGERAALLDRVVVARPAEIVVLPGVRIGWLVPLEALLAVDFPGRRPVEVEGGDLRYAQV